MMTGRGRKSGSGCIVHPASRASRGQPDCSGEMGCRGFPEGKWSIALMMSRPSPLCVRLYPARTQFVTLGGFNGDNGWFCSSGFCHQFCLFDFPPLYQNNHLCVAPNASVTFSAALFQPSVLEVRSCQIILHPNQLETGFYHNQTKAATFRLYHCI